MKSKHLFVITTTILLVLTMVSPGYAAGVCFPVIHQPPRLGEKFRFEDYKDNAKDEEKLRHKLLELYPIGSSYKKMVTEMNNIPCNKCYEHDKRELSCTYLISTYIVTGHSWNIQVSQSRGKITKINLYKAPLAL
jgi:hypothetical protein